MRYRARLSGPLLDRIDLHVEVPRLAVATLASSETGEGSAAVAARVLRARRRQEQRRPQTGVGTNARLPERAVRELVPLGPEERRALTSAVDRLGLSPRAFVRLLKVARTIADLESADAAASEPVRLPHILEAVQYRAFDRGVL